MSLMDVMSAKFQDWLWDVKEEDMIVEKKQPEKIVEEEKPEEEMPLPRDTINELVQEKKIVTRDGVEIQMRIVPGKPGPENKGKGKVMLLASPLGFKDAFYAFRPIINHFGDEYTYVNWAYRGLFDSTEAKRLRLLSIRDHAEDGLEVLRGAGFEHADVLAGYSMGVQVCLEFVLLYPEAVSRLVLVNGGHGGVFQTAFQPFVRVPFVGNISEYIIKTLLNNNPKRVMELVKKLLTIKPLEKTLKTIGKYGGSKLVVHVSGEGFINEWINMYFGGLADDDKSAANYCRLFQELNAHSVYHLLHTIEHPTLLVSGAWDYLTPSYLMKEIANQMPNAVYHKDWYSTHLTLVEHPEAVVEKAEEFLRNTRHERCSSVHFRQIQTLNETSSEN